MAFPYISGGPVDRGTFDRFRTSIDPEWVEEALAATGTATVRKRRLPATQVLWLVVGMALFRNLSIVEVVRELQLALPGKKGRDVAPSAVAQARARMGPEPVRWLFEKVAAAWAMASACERHWRGLALIGLDGTTVRVPDSEENRRTFGPLTGGPRGVSGYPLVRLVTLMALRTHLLIAARFGPYGKGEVTYSRELWEFIPDKSLTIIDRNFFSARILMGIRGRGPRAHWLIRAKSNLKWQTLERLARGDELVEMTTSRSARAEDPTLPERWKMRAIEYKRRGFRPQVLLTSLTDEAKWPSKEIIELYHERWELELGFDEVKTEMLEREESIRSQKPQGVEQELWGLLLAYNLIRREMQFVAEEAGVAPRRVSFIAGLRLVRTTLLGLVFASPGVIPKRLEQLRADLKHFILPPRRTARRYPRAVKIKMSPYARKRPRIQLRASSGGRAK